MSALAPEPSLAASRSPGWGGGPSPAASSRSHASSAARPSVTRMPAPARNSSAAASDAGGGEGGRRRRGALGGDRQARLGRPAAAQRLVRVDDQVAQHLRVSGGEVHRRCAERLRPVVERAVVGRHGEPAGGRLVEHVEARVQAGGQWARAQDARAEAVDGADPGAVDRPRVLVLADLHQPPAHPLAQLPGRLLGEREREDRADGDAVLEHRLDEALDHHRGLARAGVGGQQRRARAVGHRRALLGGERRPGGGEHGAHAGSSAARQMPG